MIWITECLFFVQILNEIMHHFAIIHPSAIGTPDSYIIQIPTLIKLFTCGVAKLCLAKTKIYLLHTLSWVKIWLNKNKNHTWLRGQARTSSFDRIVALRWRWRRQGRKRWRHTNPCVFIRQTWHPLFGQTFKKVGFVFKIFEIWFWEIFGAVNLRGSGMAVSPGVSPKKVFPLSAFANCTNVNTTATFLFVTFIRGCNDGISAQWAD